MIQQKQFQVLDLFAGAGGFGLGFRLLENHYKLIASLEVDKWAVETLEANNVENQKIIKRDIRDFKTSEQIVSACSARPDVIIGGPPCQGFSFAGPSKDPKDPRNSLFKNFAQWVEVLSPMVFVMENVKGLLTRKNENGEKVIQIITDTFQRIGYSIKIWELNAANYGVPQNRTRVFIVGNRLGVEMMPPSITHYLPTDREKLNGERKKLKMAINVINAIGDFPKLKASEGQEKAVYNVEPKTTFQELCRNGNNVLYNHVTMSHTQRIVQRFEQILKGLSIDEIPEKLKVRKRNGNGDISESKYRSNYRLLRADMISYTIPASFYSNFIHPNQPRNITSREAARLQSFPDNYIFKGKRTQISSKLLEKQGKGDENYLSQYNQIGNAVPPLLAKAIAKRLFDYLTIFDNHEVKSISPLSPKNTLLQDISLPPPFTNSA